MSHRQGWSIALVGALIMCLGVGAANAIPRYSARYGQKCLLCHQNPTGGGMRSTYASQFIVPVEMTMRDSGDDPGEGFDPYLNESITIGADMRTLAAYTADDQKHLESNLFQMQGDIYVSAQLDERFQVYFDRGISTSYELYGLGFILPAGGYVKMGRFAPDYGWRFADHKAYVRDMLGFAPPTHSDVGMEVGFYPGTSSISFAFLNGEGGSTRSANDRPAIAARAELRLKPGPANLAIGGSFYQDRESDGARRIAGPFAYVSWGPLTWLGEVDWEEDFSAAAGKDLTALAGSQEITWELRTGLALRGTVNFYDPDLDAKSGARSRYGIGFDVMPMPYLDVITMLNFHRFDEGSVIAGDDYAQMEMMIHFFY
jgi:hypothetical protein